MKRQRMPGRFFYGWLIVAASFVILMLAYGMQFSFGVFLPHIMADLNLDRASASAPFSLYVVFYTFCSIVTGPATDRFGPRKVVIMGGLLLGLGYFLLSTATEGWQLYLYFGAIAGAGMSASYIPLNVTVVRWFDQRRGMALAFMGTGTNAAVLFLPMLSALLIPVLGWREAVMILGLAGSAVIICCALTLVRDPGARNLLPDGGSQGLAGVDTPPPVQQESLNLKQARTEPAFWIIMGVFFLTWVMTFFPYVHLAVLAADMGYGPASAASAVAALGVGGIAGRVVIGWLADKFGRILSLNYSLQPLN
jgi:MFS family permease